jgi:hypothetical protein
MMSQLRRQLLLAVVDDQPGLAEQLYVFTQFVRCDELLSWLIDNNITGKNFQDWVKARAPRFNVFGREVRAHQGEGASPDRAPARHRRP